MNLKKALQIAALALTLGTAGTAGAATIVKDATNTVSIPGLTGFATTGAMMDGMSVTACFGIVDPTCQTVFWSDTGATSGGAFGTGWSLSLTGDSFGGAWLFDFTSDTLGQLTSLILDGSTGFTVFDTTSPSFGTDGSAQGMDFAILNNANLDGLAIATYSMIVAVSPAGPVGDLFHVLTVTFDGNAGPRTDFSFVQDTDNDSRFGTVSEPGTLSLLALGFVAAGLARRRRQ